MKKILFAIAIVLTLGLTVNAQGRDGFFSSWNDDNYNNRTGSGTGTPNIVMPGDDIFGTNENGTGAPLGSGLLVLTALGAGYAVARKKRS